MKIDANYDLMRDVDSRFRAASGLRSRAHYSIFYGPLRRSRILMINANPGGSPSSYQIVDVEGGEHEYIEGKHSGQTTRNGAEMLMHIAGSSNPESLRGVQVLNRYFRRSPGVDKKSEQSHMKEARPFLNELLNYIQPEAILFGGDSGVDIFARAHGGTAIGGDPIKGPNGSNEANYFREYELRLPEYRTVAAYGVYHPSKMNRVFRETVFPILRDRLGPLMPSAT
jgi:hypothetical protein